jgi:peptide-methionine (S)-S-oxide reductase
MRVAGPVLAGLVLCGVGAAAEEGPTAIPPPAIDNPLASGESQTAVLAGGCYWGTQGVFEHVIGVKRVVAGFAEGVYTDSLGQAETVKITFDPAQITYGQLLQIYFSVVHDPTQQNRQGPDVGVDYRSNIFYTDGGQQKIALAYIAQLGKAGVFHAPIVTRVDALKKFKQVGIVQQDFLIKNPHSEYIVANDLPKIADLQRLFPSMYRASPVKFHE